MAWRCRFPTARRSQRGRVVAERFPRRSLLGYRHAVVCDDWEDAPRARFDSLSYSLLAPGADAMSAAHETHLTRLWDHLGSWFAIEDRV